MRARLKGVCERTPQADRVVAGQSGGVYSRPLGDPTCTPYTNGIDRPQIPALSEGFETSLEARSSARLAQRIAPSRDGVSIAGAFSDNSCIRDCRIRETCLMDRRQAH